MDLALRMRFNATLEGGKPLPSWLHFEHHFVDGHNEGVFYGTPPQVQSVLLRVKSWVPQQSIASVFELDCEALGPYVNRVMPDISASIGDPIEEIVPKDSIVDPDGDKISYSAMSHDGSPLPEWLHFDPEKRSFEGTPKEKQVVQVVLRGLSAEHYLHYRYLYDSIDYLVLYILYIYKFVLCYIILN